MEIMGEVYTIDQPLIDWLTVTSFEESMRNTTDVIMKRLFPNRERKQGVKRLQYLGESIGNELGTIFYGESVQKGRWHSMVQVSGELCNESELLAPLYSAIRQGWGKLTRIDIQMTTYRPEGWKQWGLFNRLKRDGVAVGWVESTDREGHEHQTVYIGNRANQRFARCYEKYTDRHLLRLEYENKGNIAASIGKMLAKGEETPASLLKLFIQITNDPEISALYLPLLEYAQTAVKPKVSRREPKTEKWLRETVLPAFARYINEHGHNPDIPELFVSALIDAEYWQV